MGRRTYVWDAEKGHSVCKATGEPMIDPNEEWKPVAPQVFGDFEPFISPVTGKVVEGRRARRYDMESNGCIDGNDVVPAGGRKLKNEAFARKHGLEHLMES